MKRTLIFTLLTTFLFSAACSDKKDDNPADPSANSPLIGTWYGVYEESWKEEYPGQKTDYGKDVFSHEELIIFEPDGTGWETTDKGDGSFTYTYVEADRSIVTREPFGDTFVYEVRELNDKILKLYFPDGKWRFMTTYNKR